MTMADTPFSPVWPGPRLLVPMAMDVLLVGSLDRRSDTKWAATRNSYEQLYFGENGTPDPFTPKAVPAVGAHLLWTLPFRLRQGAQLPAEAPGAGGVRFPAVPNRWVVLRVEYRDGCPDPELTAAVLESDHVSPFVDGEPEYPDFDDARQPVKRIGRQVRLEAWDGAAGMGRPVLRAAGPGDVAWAATYDNVTGVFGLHDPLPDVKGWYTYHVSGWYADPAADPLHAVSGDDEEAWRVAVEEELRWSVGGQAADLRAARQAWAAWKASRGIDDGGDPALPRQLREAMERWRAWRAAHGVAGPGPALPRQLLCHGTVATVRWDGWAVAYGTGAPGNGKVAEVAVGNTAAEAVSAYLARKVVDRGSEESIPVIERALEAFEKGLLYELQDDVVGTENRLHGARFGTSAGGTEWIVVRADAPAQGAGGPPAPDQGGQLGIPLDPAQTAALTALDEAQRAHDERVRRLHTQRWELFALSQKESRLDAVDPPEDVRTKVTTALSAVRAAVGQGVDEVKALRTGVDRAETRLRDLLGTEYVLKAVDLPPFAAPHDPVVMVGGIGHDRKLSPPEENGQELLLVRFTGQGVTGLRAEVPTGEGGSVTVEVGAAELLGSIALPAGKGVPKELADLWVEAVFLDPSAAPLLARLACAKAGVKSPGSCADTLAPRIRAEQRAAWGTGSQLDVRHLRAGSWLRGVLPSPLAVELREGQPWAPLFLDWKVAWHPAPPELEGWTLGDVDYAWTPPYTVGPAAVELSGRTVLNPATAHSLQARFATFEQAPAELPEMVRRALANARDVVKKLDVLTQSLGGFTDQLLTRATRMNRAPADGAVRTLLADAPVTYQPRAGNPRATTPAPAFHPLRAGHLQLLDLWVVDQFGQVMRGKEPTEAAIAYPIRAQSLATPEPTAGETANRSFLQLPPRLSQPARLELRLLQADAQDRVASTSADATSPLCGWVMPNHLDDSLMVFDAAGVNLGAVLAVERDVEQPGAPGTGLRWEAVPGSDAALGAPPHLPNPHLQRFVEGLLAQGLAGSGALRDLLDAIDSSLWHVDPFGEQEGNLSLLLGRPLAVVRASVSLSLHGTPVYDQAWGETGRWYLDGGRYVPRPPPFVSTRFRVRVGDLGHATNGVLGYFQDDDYARFYAVYGAGAQTAPLRRALQRGRLRPGQALRLLESGAAAGRGFAGGYVRRDHLVQLAPDDRRVLLTLLMEPRGVIPTIAGSLPAATASLAPGPVARALRAMKATFRVGPVLADPRRIRMPLPAQVRGKWGWVARRDVTGWRAEAAVEAGDDLARMDDAPRVLGEGWLTLSGAEAPPKP